MSPGVGYAILSMLAAGLLDVMYARYSGKRAVTGTYLFAIGVVMIVGQSATLVFAPHPLAFDARGAAWGIAAGAIVMVGNAMLMESLARLNVSLGSTIYRLNTIAVVVFAVLFLHEVLTSPKLAGVGLGIAAVVMLYQRGGRGGDDTFLKAAVWLAVGAALLRATFGIMTKVGLTRGADPFVFSVYIAVGWALAALVYGLVRTRRAAPAADVLRYALVNGTLICLVVTFLLLALRVGEASVVIPIANMSFVAAVLISVAFGMERLTGRKIAAVACAAAAITLLTRA